MKGKVTEFLMGMELEGSIVPSSDGVEPSYLIGDVISESVFGQGVVIVELDDRPVRAMDYIYATIKVEA